MRGRSPACSPHLEQISPTWCCLTRLRRTCHHGCNRCRSLQSPSCCRKFSVPRASTTHPSSHHGRTMMRDEKLNTELNTSTYKCPSGLLHIPVSGDRVRPNAVGVTHALVCFHAGPSRQIHQTQLALHVTTGMLVHGAPGALILKKIVWAQGARQSASGRFLQLLLLLPPTA